MLRFVLSTLWKVYVLFFVVHILSHWSDIEALFDKCPSSSFPVNANIDQKSVVCDDTYYDLMKRIFVFGAEASNSALTSLLEVINFVIFIGKRSVFYVKSRTYYERYLAEKENHS
jgi:hypothetical protein